MSAYIHIKDACLRFRVYRNPSPGLKESVVQKLTKKKRPDQVLEFDALKNINLCIEGGERLGIIGLNGAGKSTLLKMIVGIYPPKSGSVAVKGKITPLIELGTGFDFELSGRENIYLNGALLGRSLQQMRGLEQAIIDFSELNEQIDLPIKYYSSGMHGRLAYSIGTIVDPEILLIDEIFSTGDAHFVQKSTQRMQQFLEGSQIVVLVSHLLPQIQEFCNRAILLHKGEIIADGSPKDIISYYNTDIACVTPKVVHKPAPKPAAPAAAPVVATTVTPPATTPAVTPTVTPPATTPAVTPTVTPTATPAATPVAASACREAGAPLTVAAVPEPAGRPDSRSSRESSESPEGGNGKSATGNAHDPEMNMARIMEMLEEGHARHELKFLAASWSGKVLNIDCGGGRALAVLLPLPELDLHGIDSSENLSTESGNQLLAHEKLKSGDLAGAAYQADEFEHAYSIGSLHCRSEEEIDKCISECYRICRLSSVHMVPVSRSGVNEGWVKRGKGYHNNSLEWWLKKFSRSYKTTFVLDSSWSDDLSTGKWIFAVKSRI